MATGADTEEIKAVCDIPEPVVRRDAPLEFGRETVIDRDHVRTPGANKVMMMVVRLRGQQLEAGTTVAEVELVHHAELFQQPERAVDSCEIASVLRQCCLNLFCTEWVAWVSKRFQNGVAGACEASRPLMEPALELGQGRARIGPSPRR